MYYFLFGYLNESHVYKLFILQINIQSYNPTPQKMIKQVITITLYFLSKKKKRKTNNNSIFFVEEIKILYD